MHRPDDSPRPSLYMSYRVHPAAPRPPAGAEPAPVAVVGGGPIGLTLALDLARHGLRVLLLQAERQVSHGSRAIVFTRRSLEILQQVGADRAAMTQGLPWRFGTSHYRGRPVFRMEAPQDPHDRFHPMLNLQQPVLEEQLVERIQATPAIELRWGHKVTGVQDGDSGVTLEVDTPEGPYTQRCHWVVACDGARSTLRQLQGLALEGDSYEGRFVIADIAIELPLPTERLAFFDPPWNPGNTVLMHRQPGKLWRIDYQLPPGETPEQALQPESLRTRIAAQLASIGFGDRPWQMDWASVYSARALTLPEYVNGHVLYCGDAAHLLPIFGVRGANTGFQDVQNLAWKLAAVQQGRAPLALLRSYGTERVAAAREIIAEAGKSTRFMTPPTRGFRLLRDATLSLALQHEFVRPLLHWRTSRPHEYTGSPLNSPDDDSRLFDAGPPPGAVMRSVCLGPDDYLLDAPLAGFLVLLFTDDAAPQADLAAVADASAGQGLALQIRCIPRTLAGGEAWSRYGVRHAGAAYLVRPDQHVCARWLTLTAERLRGALHRAHGH